MKEIERSLKVLLVGLLGATVLMLMVNLLPTEQMKKHIKESAEVMEIEQDYHEVLPGMIASRLDNFTDSIMLVSSAHKEDKNIIDRAMNVYRVRYSEKSPSQTLVAYGRDEEGYTTTTYSRYWHGYQLVLKPLLLFFNYQEIRYLNFFVQALLIAGIILEMKRQNQKKYIYAYVVMIFSLMPASIGLSLQFSSVFYITNIAVYVLLKWWAVWKEKNNIILLFLMTGMLTSFMDFLTYPLVTLGVPVVFYFLLKEEDTLFHNLIEIVKYSIIWAVGYIGMWGGKWIIGSLLLRKNIIADAFGAVAERTSSETIYATFTKWDVVVKNAETMFETPVRLLFIGTFVILCGVTLVKSIQHKKNYFKNYHYLLIACMPVAWYVVTENHSYMHFWFTYREFSILIFALLVWAFANVKQCLRQDNA